MSQFLQKSIVDNLSRATTLPKLYLEERIMQLSIYNISDNIGTDEFFFYISPPLQVSPVQHVLVEQTQRLIVSSCVQRLMPHVVTSHEGVS